MIANFRRSFAAALYVTVLLGGGMLSCAQTLPNGLYETEVTLGPVLLAGRYPCYLADVEAGLITVATSPTGALSGSINLAGRTTAFTGQISTRPKGIRLNLRGKLPEGRITVKATLEGGQFVGTAKIGGKKAPCRIDVSGVAPVTTRYLLMLEFAGASITGPGTLFVGQQEVPVTVRGRTEGGGGISLSVQGTGVRLVTSTGTSDGTEIAAEKWTAQGFGALQKGTNLRIKQVVP